MELAITLVVGLLLICLSLFLRHRRGFELDINKAILTSFGVGVALGFVLIPGLWLSFSLSLHGGPIENNMLPGTEPGELFVHMVIGALAAAGVALTAYIEGIRKQ